MIIKLKQFISLARLIVPLKATQAVLQSACLSDNKISVTDLEHRFEMEYPLSTPCFIPFKYLQKIIRMKPCMLEIQPGRIRTEINKLNFKQSNIEKYPVIEHTDFTLVDVWDNNIVKQFSTLRRFISTDELKPVLNRVQIIKDESITATATNGHILKEITDITSRSNQKYSIYLTQRSIDILCGFKKEISVSISKEYYCFECLGFKLYQRLINEKYPDTTSIIPCEFTGKAKVRKLQLLTALSISLPFTHPKTKLGVFNIEKENLCIASINKEEQTEFDYCLDNEEQEGDKIQIGFNLKFMETLLKNMNSEYTTLKYNNPLSAMVITNNSHEMCLIMPIRLEGDA